VENEITKVEPDQTQLAIPADAPLMTRLAMMMERGIKIDVDQMAKMQEIAERFEANEARKAFHVAMAKFKEDPPKIFKNKTVTYGTGDNKTSYKHITLAKLATILDEAFSKCDLSFTWKTEDLEKGLIKVTCILTHMLGHSESSCMTSLADGSGSKNPIQAKGSAITYLQRYTLKSVAGVAEEGDDDDGNGAYNQAPPPPQVQPVTSEEKGIIKAICEKLPKKPGLTPNVSRITAICIEKSRDYLSVQYVEQLTEHLALHSSDADLYIETPTEQTFIENEIPGEFGA